ncbi:MAG: hypothetical protein ACJ0G0_07350 [Alphaproteobacteria bacterium]|jgi:hypothetical protein|tara:strand:+ start:110 stop:325 length:216 start_codon:yes stop_codon:yes gene_type:complete
MKKFEEQLWIDKEKKIISCIETNKVLNENFLEVYNVLQSAIDDGILMGCDEEDFKKKLKRLVNDLSFSIGK